MLYQNIKNRKDVTGIRLFFATVLTPSFGLVSFCRITKLLDSGRCNSDKSKMSSIRASSSMFSLIGLEMGSRVSIETPPEGELTFVTIVLVVKSFTVSENFEKPARVDADDLAITAASPINKDSNLGRILSIKSSTDGVRRTFCALSISECHTKTSLPTKYRCDHVCFCKCGLTWTQ